MALRYDGDRGNLTPDAHALEAFRFLRKTILEDVELALPKSDDGFVRVDFTINHTVTHGNSPAKDGGSETWQAVWDRRERRFTQIEDPKGWPVLTGEKTVEPRSN